MNGLTRSCTKPAQSGAGPGGEVDEKFGSTCMQDPVQVSRIFRRIGKDLADREAGYHVHNIAICGTANVIAAIDGTVTFVEGAIFGAEQILTMLQADLPSRDAALSKRLSVRAFLPMPVTRSTIEELFALTCRSASNTKIQP